MTNSVSAPGRVNLIGEHIDYHGLPVLPIALQRRIRVSFQARADRLIRAMSAGYDSREFTWTESLDPAPSGDWENYVRAAAQAIAGKWGLGNGIDANVTSDLPQAAGLSSSSALIVAFALALLRANGHSPTFEELMEVLPEGEHFVGTRGGGMDHAASLASREGCASLIHFAPLSLRTIPIPSDWRFIVAHSLTVAEKSGAKRAEYNARRAGGVTALAKLGFASYHEAIHAGVSDLRQLEVVERDAFLHVTTESRRVQQAVDALESADRARFGELLLESHASLRDRLKVSSPALDRLVDAAMQCGALGARLTGAGFGGCAVIFTTSANPAGLRRALIKTYYAGEPQFNEAVHLIDAQPANGALFETEGS